MESDRVATLAELVAGFEERTGKKLGSSSPIRRVLSKLKLSRKKRTFQATERNSAR